MQNLNINYIIGVFVLLAAGWLGYVIFQGDEVMENTQKQAVENYSTTTQIAVAENNVATSTETKKEETKKTNMNNSKQESYKVTMNTNYGTVVLELDGKKAPNTAYNFAQIARMGGYNGVKFHRIIKGFMIQGGDPLTKDDSQQGAWGTGGTGWDGKKFVNENSGLSNVIGSISMANAGSSKGPGGVVDTNGSQFFINTGNNTFLDGKHTVFGKVVSGMDVVVKMENVKTMFPGQLDRPEKPVVINSVTVE
jgi:cyclophilin family peptidyl-prolyl cis-trans isomerase